MALFRAQVVFKGKSALPEDVVVNTFHFQAEAVGNAAADDITAQLVEFYNTMPPQVTGGVAGPITIASGLSSWLDRAVNACKIKVYNMADALPRLPIERTFTLAPGSASDPELPAEVAVVASFYAGRNAPRTRGRVYLGPWRQGMNEDSGTTDRSRPNPILTDSIAGSLQRLMNKPVAGAQLVVYSRGEYQRLGVKAPPVPPTAAVVTNGWVDDAWDIQRRRGQSAGFRRLVSRA